MNGHEKLWLCPVNEPSLYPLMTGMARDEAIGMAITMVKIAHDHHPDVGILTNDPITELGSGSSTRLMPSSRLSTWTSSG